jgi:phenylacetate-CoA ligase
MISNQVASFQKLLNYVWRHSPFYQDFYSSHGIKEKDLPALTVRDLPFLSKQLLMEHFDAAVTDSRLRKRELEQWIQDNPDPRQNFQKDFIVVHSSGSSGDVGIFVYDRRAVQMANFILASYLPQVQNSPSGKIKVAFYVASHGHFAAVSRAVRMPLDFYELLIVSVLDPVDDVVQQLNAFQPHQLGGYSSSVSRLARSQLQGRLHIHPSRIFVGGDKLTAAMKRTIQEAWEAPTHLMYSASESSCIALKRSGEEEMIMIEDLNIVEVLDPYNQPVLPGAEGRVVLTNLYNYILPILRYELGDDVVLGKRQTDSCYATIRDIRDRGSVALPVLQHDGTRDTISHLVLRELFVAGVDKVQFISRRPDHVEVRYVGTLDLDSSVRYEFQRILNIKGASQTTFEVRRVEHIDNDPKTGKFALVKVEAGEGSDWR